MRVSEIENEEDFAAMFAASVQSKRFENGQQIEGTIVAIGPEVAFVSVGAKGEATIELTELRDEDSSCRASCSAAPRRSGSWKTRSARACPSKARSTSR